MGKFKIKPMFAAAASPGKVEANAYDAQGNIITSDKTEATDAVPATKGKKITKPVFKDDYKDTGGGYASDADWTKFLATDAGKEYTKKHTKQVDTGEREPDTPFIPATKGGETGHVVATTKVGKKHLDINSERTDIRQNEMVTRKRYKTNVKQGFLDYDAAIHGDNERAYKKKVKKEAKKIRFDQDAKNLDKTVKNNADGIGTSDGGTYYTEENKGAKNISKEDHEAAQLKAAENGVTTSGVKESPKFTVKHESDSSGTKFGNFLRGKGFNKTNKEGKVVTTGTNNNDNLNQGGGKGQGGGKNETEELDKSM